MGVWAKGQRSIWENVDFPSRNGVNGKPVSPWTRIRTIMISTGCSPATTYLRAQLDVVRIPKRKPSTGSKCAPPNLPLQRLTETSAVNVAEEENGKPESLRCQD